MTKNDLKRFGLIMAGLAENFSAQLSDAGITMRFEAMKDLTIEQIDQAAKEILRTRKYLKMPTVAEFLEHIYGDPESKALVQATRVLEAIKRIGGNATVAFDDPTTQAVIKSGFGGWVKLCNEILEDTEKWFIKDFCKIYQSYMKEGVKHFGRLAGRTEMANFASGYLEHIPELVLIGDKAEAKKIAESKQTSTNLLEGKSNVIKLIQGIGK